MLAALRAAHLAGAQVKIIYHGLDDDTGRTNARAIADAQIAGLCRPRTNAKLMHNKFIVLSRDGQPVSVWTGSTNISRNALFGQLNVGHAIHDRALARRFMDYWTALTATPSPRPQGLGRSRERSPAGRETDALTPSFRRTAAGACSTGGSRSPARPSRCS